MEERFEKMHCPNCGKEMHRGVTTKSERPYLDWFPGRKAPSWFDMVKMPNVEKADTLSKGVRFVGSVGNWFLSYRPSWYCLDCDLLLIDTKTELERV